MCISLLRAGQSALSLSGIFSFDVKRESENHQRFRRAGSTRKGLLAPFRPQRRSRNGKKLVAALRRVAAPSVCFAAARILLAAAPTAPPCFRRWRRSSPLLPKGEPLRMTVRSELPAWGPLWRKRAGPAIPDRRCLPGAPRTLLLSGNKRNRRTVTVQRFQGRYLFYIDRRQPQASGWAG